MGPLKGKMFRFVDGQPDIEEVEENESVAYKHSIKSAVEYLKDKIKGTHLLSFDEDSNGAQYNEDKLLKAVDEAFEDVVKEKK